MIKVLPVINIKGGVAKTTTAFNLAMLFSQDRKTIVIDLDGQCDLTRRAKVKYKNDLVDEDGVAVAKKTIIDCLKNPKKIKSAIRKTRYGFDLISGDEGLYGFEKTAQEGNTALAEVIKTLEGLGYEVCVLDFSPSYSKFTIEALTSATFVIVPGEASDKSFKGFKRILNMAIEIMKNTKRQFLVGFLPVKISGKSDLETLEEFRSSPLGALVLPLVIRDDKTNIRRSEKGRPLVKRSCKASDDYRELYSYLKKRGI